MLHQITPNTTGTTTAKNPQAYILECFRYVVSHALVSSGDNPVEAFALFGPLRDDTILHPLTAWF
jgi:hypothetical protein